MISEAAFSVLILMGFAVCLIAGFSIGFICGEKSDAPHGPKFDGYTKKAGVNCEPTHPRPDIEPVGQKPIYSDEPIGEIKIVDDFLPKPADL